MAQAILAILLASAMAAILVGRRVVVDDRGEAAASQRSGNCIGNLVLAAAFAVLLCLPIGGSHAEPADDWTIGLWVTNEIRGSTGFVPPLN